MLKFKRHQIRNFFTTVISILVGNALLALCVAAFIIPHDIIMGGTTGIGIVLEGSLHIETALIVLILNIVLLLFGWIILGHKFFLTTVASSILYPVFLGLLQRIPGIDTMTDNTLLAALFGGVLMGVSLGMVVRAGSSTGGMDVVCLVLHKWFHFPVSALVWVTDFLVIGGQAVFARPEDTLLGLVVLILETMLIEQVMIVGKSKIQIMIFSSQYEEIRKKLLYELSAGATMLYVQTGHLQNEQKAVLCIIPSRKLHDATELIHKVDPTAFLTITKIKEVRGHGFTLDRQIISLDEKKED